MTETAEAAEMAAMEAKSKAGPEQSS